jgi:hypothetical protein
MRVEFDGVSGTESSTYKTTYEQFESSEIRYSQYPRCDAPHKNPCRFYDKNDIEICSIKLPIDGFEVREGVIISYDNTKIFIKSYVKNKSCCYSLVTSKLLWKLPIKEVAEIMPYEDYAYVVSVTSRGMGDSHGGIYKVNAQTGEVLGIVLQSKFVGDFIRLNEHYVLIALDKNYSLFDFRQEKLYSTTMEYSLGAWTRVCFERKDENSVYACPPGYRANGIPDFSGAQVLNIEDVIASIKL